MTELDKRSEPSAAQEAPAAPLDAAPDRPFRKRTPIRGKMLAAILLAALLLGGSLTGLLLDLVNKHKKATEMSDVVLTCGDYQMTNTELAYYYWSEYFYFTNVYKDYLSGMLDTSKPLDEQMYDSDTSWQDYLLEQALVTVKDTLSMVFKAQEENFTMPADYEKSYEKVLSDFSGYAVKLGFTKEDGSADIGAYLQDSYGEGATLESFQNYLYDSYLASAYSDSLYNAIQPTDEEIEAYFDAHADEYAENYDVSKTDGPMLDAIVLSFTDYDDNKAMASTVYANWQANGGGQDALSALSETYCKADGVTTDIYPGELDDAVNSWLFASGRKEGEHAVLTGSDGKAYIVMFTGFSDRCYWQELAETDLRSETYNNAFLKIEDGYTFLIDYDKVVLKQPAGLYDTQNAEAERAAASSSSTTSSQETDG